MTGIREMRMNKHEDIISYDVYELDLYGLRRKMETLNVKEAVVYGIGNNGYDTYMLFKNLGIRINYFVDVKAMDGTRKFNKIEVKTPDEFAKSYNGEYVVISPSLHDAIYSWMLEKNIPESQIILSFYKTESITIDYGEHYGAQPSVDIEYCREKPENIKGTFVTIAYNTPENLLRRAIESVLRQTVKELKYLFIINGATDGTSDVVASYAALDSRISVIDMGENLRWTDTRLLKAIKDNIEGKYCCQLDSDDYYDERFLEKAVKIGEENNADIVCVRTCLFSADSNYTPLDEGLVYDWHDKFYFNMVHPLCHVIGHKNILTAYARSKICSTFWGKLYANTLMGRYLDYLILLPDKDRELYYRLDIAMTYRILSMSERLFYSDEVLHFSQYSKKNSTFTLAPIEWLMSLWYSYLGMKEEFDAYYRKKRARKYLKEFLTIHLPWMVGRRGMLSSSEQWNYRDLIIGHFGEMADDPLFKNVLLHKRKFMKNECMEFYETICTMACRSGDYTG